MSILEEYQKWWSPSLGREFEMLVFGHAGLPLILFPTSKGSYYQYKDQGMMETVRWFLENGKIRIYCPGSIDADSWYDENIPPAQRAFLQDSYDRMVLTEIVPRALQETGYQKIAVAGCSFGGYHAVNFAFRHPSVTAYCFSMSGIFDIRSFTGGYYDDTIYYNNPVDFIPDNNDPHCWKMGIILGTGDADSCRSHNELLSGILAGKQISHWLDIRPDRTHDWPLWKELFPYYLSLLP